MDRSAVETLSCTHVDPLRDFLGLTDWRITTDHCSIAGDNTLMSVDVNRHSYQRALIAIDYRWIDTEEEYLDHLAHEMGHILHADFYGVEDTVKASIDPEDASTVRVIEHAMRHAAERFVLRFEWLWRNHLRERYLEQMTKP